MLEKSGMDSDHVLVFDNESDFARYQADKTILERGISDVKSKLPEAQEGRIRGLVALRECTQELINLQLEDYSDAEITAKQAELNERYDEFTKKYGLISAPFYPVFPAIAFGLGLVCLFAMVWFNAIVVAMISIAMEYIRRLLLTKVFNWMQMKEMALIEKVVKKAPALNQDQKGLNG